MSESSDPAPAIEAFATVLIILALVFGIRWFVNWAQSRPTTYCTSWTKAVSIKPVYEDNGKYEDEQYIVTYEDGSVDGQDNGLIPFARCTNKVEVHESKAKDEWKRVSGLGNVDWED